MKKEGLRIAVLRALYPKEVKFLEEHAWEEKYSSKSGSAYDRGGLINMLVYGLKKDQAIATKIASIWIKCQE